MNCDYTLDTGTDADRQFWVMTALGNICWILAIQVLWRLAGLAVLACVLAIPPPTQAGSIRYDFDDIHYPHSPIARMEVDDSALTRGYFVNADLRNFGFNLFGAADLDPFRLTIAPDGMPAGPGWITGHTVIFGTNYSLYADFGGTLAGFWRVSTFGSQGANGNGYWTATLIPGDPPGVTSVAEPSSLILWCVALVLIFLVRRAIR